MAESSYDETIKKIKELNNVLKNLEMKRSKMEKERGSYHPTNPKWELLDNDIFANKNDMSWCINKIRELSDMVKDMAISEFSSSDCSKKFDWILEGKNKYDAKLKLTSGFEDILPRGTEWSFYDISTTSDKPILASPCQLKKWKIHGEPEWKITYSADLKIKLPDQSDDLFSIKMIWSTPDDLAVIPWIRAHSSSMFIEYGLVESIESVNKWIFGFKESIKEHLFTIQSFA